MIFIPMGSLKIAELNITARPILNLSLNCIVLHKSIFHIIDTYKVVEIQMEFIQEKGLLRRLEQITT